jgi:DNA polymerase-3 subunit delta'
MLFLVCHQPAAILPTIRSRCRTLALRAPDMQAFGEILNRFAPSIANHEYAALYGLSHGSAGQAMALFEEGGLKWYADWLDAMQPDASAQVRQRFADAVNAAKSPRSWEAVIHAWHVVMQRISLFPHYDTAAPICRQEQERLAAIAASTNPARCHAWVEEGRRLIHQTETFHLDKRQTIRMLADPAQLDMLAA